jgi:membrane-associated phospholipid phosphatase
MDLGLRFPSTQLALALVFGVCVIDAVGFATTGLRLEPKSLETWLIAAIASVGLVLLCRAAIWRLRDDTARGALRVKSFAERTGVMAAANLYVGLFTTSGAILTYFAAMLALPFQDERILAVDRALGVDWMAIATYVCSHPRIEAMLGHAYMSSMAQVTLLVPILAFTRQYQRLSEFLALFALTGVIVVAISAVAPAQSAFFHLPSAVICPHVVADHTLAYHADLMALRSGTMEVMTLSKMTGIVTFPSFHTVLAILVMYAAWNTPFLKIPAIILNSLVIAATLPHGGHYLTDVVVGAAIAFSSIAAVRALNRRRGSTATASPRPFALASDAA